MMCMTHAVNCTIALEMDWLRSAVIVITFWYVFGMDLTFLNFFKLYFHLGLITTPHVFYVHMTYVYSLFPCFTLHTITWPREVIIVL